MIRSVTFSSDLPKEELRSSLIEYFAQHDFECFSKTDYELKFSADSRSFMNPLKWKSTGVVLLTGTSITCELIFTPPQLTRGSSISTADTEIWELFLENLRSFVQSGEYQSKALEDAQERLIRVNYANFFWTFIISVLVLIFAHSLGSSLLLSMMLSLIASILTFYLHLWHCMRSLETAEASSLYKFFLSADFLSLSFVLTPIVVPLLSFLPLYLPNFFAKILFTTNSLLFGVSGILLIPVYYIALGYLGRRISSRYGWSSLKTGLCVLSLVTIATLCCGWRVYVPNMYISGQARLFALRVASSSYSKRLSPIIDSYVSRYNRIPTTEELLEFTGKDLPKTGVTIYDLFLQGTMQGSQISPSTTLQPCGDSSWFITWNTRLLGMLINGDAMYYSPDRQCLQNWLHKRNIYPLGSWFYESE